MTFLECLLWLRDHDYLTLVWPTWMGEGCITNQRRETVLEVIEREQRRVEEEARLRTANLGCHIANSSDTWVWAPPNRYGTNHYLIEVALTNGGGYGAFVYDLPSAPTRDVSIALCVEDSVLPPELRRQNVLEDFPGWFERPYVCSGLRDGAAVGPACGPSRSDLESLLTLLNGETPPE